MKPDAKMTLNSLFCYLLIALPLYPITLYLKIYRNWLGIPNGVFSELVQRMLDFSRHATVLKTGRRQLVTAGSNLRRNSASPSCQYHTPTQFISRKHAVYSLCHELLNIHHSLFHLFIQTWIIIHSVENVRFVKGSGHILLLLTESLLTLCCIQEVYLRIGIKNTLYNSLCKCLSYVHLPDRRGSDDVCIFYDSDLQVCSRKNNKRSQLELVYNSLKDITVLWVIWRGLVRFHQMFSWLCSRGART